MKKNCNNCRNFIDPVKSGKRYRCNGYPKPTKDGQVNWLSGLSCKHALNAISYWKPRRLVKQAGKERK